MLARLGREAGMSFAESSKCNSCQKGIAADEYVFHCVSCNKTMHLNEKCTGLSKTAIAAIKEIGANLLLFCNHCVATSRKELVLSSNVKETASLDLRNEYADLKNAIQDIRESVEKVAEKATTDSGGRQEELTGLTSCVKDLKKTFAQALKWPPCRRQQ